MNRTSVDSSNLASIGYDSQNEILEIEFHSGGVYQYDDVPMDVYTGLMQASSHGRYFHAYIKDVYAYRRVR